MCVFSYTPHTPFVKSPPQFFPNLLPHHSHTPTPSSHCYYIRTCLTEEVQCNPSGGLDSESQSEGKWLYHLFLPTSCTGFSSRLNGLAAPHAFPLTHPSWHKTCHSCVMCHTLSTMMVTYWRAVFMTRRCLPAGCTAFWWTHSLEALLCRSAFPTQVGKSQSGYDHVCC